MSFRAQIFSQRSSYFSEDWPLHSRCLLVEIGKQAKLKQKLTKQTISGRPRHRGLRRLWGWKRRQEAAERHAAGDSSVWPRGLSLQMAASPSASPPSSASLTAPEWLYDSSTVKPSANQPQNTSTGPASLCGGLNHVRECLWVVPLEGLIDSWYNHRAAD